MAATVPLVNKVLKWKREKNLKATSGDIREEVISGQSVWG